MQLACPNCDAKYEVPDDAIPEAGRDVQCSGCGHAWFQHPATAGPDPLSGMQPPALTAAEDAAYTAEGRSYDSFPGGSQDWEEENPPHEAAQPPLPSFPPAPPLSTARPAAPLSAPSPGSDPADTRLADLLAAHEASGDDAGDAGYEDEPPAPAPRESRAGPASPPPAPPAPPAPASRRDLEDSVLAILREEAELEAEARRLEAQRLANRRLAAEAEMQTQPDLGLDQAVAPAPVLSAAQKRLAMLRGEDLEDDPPTPVPAGESPRPAQPRRDLLPDVEEINSTLKPEENGFDADAEVEALPDLTRSSGFRSGFVLALVVLGLGTIAYVLSDRIGAALPSAKAPLDSYVSLIDGLRLWLNGVMDRASEALRPGSGG